MKRTLLIGFSIVSLLFVACSNGNKSTGKKKKNVLESIDSTYILQFFAQHPEYSKYRSKVLGFYRKRDFEVAWSDKGKPLPHTAMFINVIQNLKDDGIAYREPKGYSIRDNFHAVQRMRKRKTPYVTTKRNELDLVLTCSYFEYAPKLWQGIIDPERDQGIEWYVKRDKISYEQMLDSILSTKARKNPFVDYASAHDQYLKLREKLHEYKQITDNKQDTIRVVNKKWTQNERSPEVLRLINKLQQLGDLPADKHYDVFDQNVQDAVKHFQERHGIKATGKVNDQTVTLLNVPLRNRIKQIMVNMERWRWLPEKLSEDYIWVNIPQFELTLYEKNKPIQTMAVIVGEEGNETTIFNGAIKFIVINPYWNIPESIAIEEVLPILQENPDYLNTQNIEVGTDWKFMKEINVDTINWQNLSEENFPYKLRKKPGKDNPLGRMKFLFPNEFSIYLHDTPNNTLFNEGKRGFSHGCIRLEKPVDLAEYLIARGTKKPVDDLQQLIEDKVQAKDKNTQNEEDEEAEEWIELTEPLPVYLVYFTSWVDNAGVIHFVEDIYNHDNTLEQRLLNNPNTAL